MALIVIGPERLPKAARTMGLLFGRLQRYVSDVKADISREMELDELRKLQKQVQGAAQEFKTSVESAAQTRANRRAQRRGGAQCHGGRSNVGGGAGKSSRRNSLRAPARPPSHLARRPLMSTPRMRRASHRCRASTRSSDPRMSDPSADSSSESQAQDTFLSHLVELRSRLMHSIIAVLVVFVALFPWAKEIYALLARPMLHALPSGAQMIATDVTGTFLVPLKVTLMGAFLIALPYVLWQAWAFVAPGLYQNEKRLALPVIASSVVFFVIGMAFAYFFVFPVMFSFFAGYTPAGVTMMTDIDKYLSFVLTMFVAFGITFEVPVIVVVLVRMRVVSLAKLRAIRPYAIVGAFVVGAVFTPPDVVSQLMLAVPLWLLYELGLLLARFVDVPRTDADEEEVAVK